MEELTQAFKVEEEAEGICRSNSLYIVVKLVILKVFFVHTVLDDDSSQLPEVMELFSDINVPVKVDRLMKVEPLSIALVPKAFMMPLYGASSSNPFSPPLLPMIKP